MCFALPKRLPIFKSIPLSKVDIGNSNPETSKDKESRLLTLVSLSD